MDLQKYIDELNSELSAVNDFDRDTVCNTFEKYITKKLKLKSYIDLGFFHYEYSKYKLFFVLSLLSCHVNRYVLYCCKRS